MAQPRIRGTIVADSAHAARDLLRSRGLQVESLVSQDAATPAWRRTVWRRGRFASQRTDMVRELSTLLVVRDRIAAGTSLAEAIRDQPQAFDELTIHMVEVGENSGTLDGVLEQLADFSERCQQLKDRVTNALICPVVVLVLACGVTVFLMMIVIPRSLDHLKVAEMPIPGSQYQRAAD